MRNAKITEILGDGPHDFRLGFGQFLELQEKTGVGPYALYKRLIGDDWFISDLYEVCRVGLIGGGMKPKDAYILAKRYVMDEPPLDNLNLARLVLVAGLNGAPDEDRAGSEKSEDDGDDKLKSRDYYGLGAVIGYTPEQVDGMSMHQLKAAFDGYVSHHNGQAGGMTEKDKDELFELVQEEQRKLDGEE